MSPDLAHAAEYRRNAAECLQAVKRLSNREDRKRLLDMAEKWLDLAKDAEVRDVRNNAAITSKALGIDVPPSLLAIPTK
jgi:hypothetical protein